MTAKLNHLWASAAAFAALIPFAGLAERYPPVSTAEAVKAAAWSPEISISLGETAFTYRSNGLPDHELAESYLVPLGQQQPFTEFEVKPSEGFVTASDIDVSIPLVPVYSETVTETSLGMIGVMISGSRLFNDYENPERSIVAMDDQHIQDGAGFLDTCNGHPLQSGASYHYHASPPCVTERVDGTGSHSKMIGVLLDGFPIYGPQGDGGVIVTNAGLDECSGHFGGTPEFPDGIYHYHLTTEDAPYSIDCYHGQVDPELAAAEGFGPGGPRGPRPDFAAIAAQLGVDQHALMDALAEERPPNFAKAAKLLGIDETALRAAMPPPPGGAP